MPSGRTALTSQLVSTAECTTDATFASATLPVATAQELDSGNIRVLNWNTQKGAQSGMHDDLARFGNQADLILLQEAAVHLTQKTRLEQDMQWVFGQGYQDTGVMTVSRVVPLSFCSLSAWEPWLRSPKVTNITSYGLSDTDDDLLVINLHLINFTLGVKAFRSQLLQATNIIEQHAGPVIISGDFNTWSRGRSALVNDALTRLGMRAIVFDHDQRTRYFGRPVDHLYMRGIQPVEATSHAVSSSDHNPFTVVLEVL